MRDIGGYIELEMPQRGEYHDALALNCARNCVRYLIRAYGIKRMYVPYYQCPLVFDAIEKENCSICFYEIDQNFLPKREFERDACILYINYFGICDKQTDRLAALYPDLIVDNSQAFYSKPRGMACFYSPRKFFGVADGAYLYTQKHLSEPLKQDHDTCDRFSHLLKRIEGGSNFGYPDFKRNDGCLENADIELMSNLTRYILAGQDYAAVSKKRRKNFKYLHEKLSKFNNLNVELGDQVPMFYPFLFKIDGLREELMKNSVYVSTLWNGFDYPENSTEEYFKYYLFPLIIDQRYGFEEMDRQADIIKNKIAALNQGGADG